MKTLLFEDFSKFTAGFEVTPDGTQLADNTYGTIPEDYLNGSGLTAFPIYQAGGSAYLGIYSDTFGELHTGFISTPSLDATGGLRVSFRVRSMLSEGDYVSFQYNYGVNGNTYGVEDQRSLRITDDWQTYEFELGIFSEAKPYLLWTSEYGGFLIDDIKVEAFVPKIAVPKALRFTNYTGTSFTANWEAVETATSYLLTVYTYNGVTPGNILEKEVKGTSYEVTGLDPRKAYYYHVQAKNEKYTSTNSNTIEVKTIAVPVLHDPTLDGDGFTISWDAAPRANKYEFWAYRKVKAKSGETVVLADTDFSDIVSEGSVDNPELLPLEYAVPSLPGWVLYSGLYIDGGIGISNFNGMFDLPTYLDSPDWDLTASGGKIKVDMDIYTPDISGVALFNYENGEYVNVDEYDIPMPTEEEGLKWNHHSVVLEGGSSRSNIAIFGLGKHGTYIDNLKVSMPFEKDGSVLFPINHTETAETSVSVPADMSLEANTYSYKVRGIYYTRDEDDETVIGDYSELHYIGDPGAVKRIAAAGVAAYMAGGILHVVNPEGLPVAVYSVNGSLVGASSDSVIELPVHGVYIVKIGDHVFKVVK